MEQEGKRAYNENSSHVSKTIETTSQQTSKQLDCIVQVRRRSSRVERQPSTRREMCAASVPTHGRSMSTALSKPSLSSAKWKLFWVVDSGKSLPLLDRQFLLFDHDTSSPPPPPSHGLCSCSLWWCPSSHARPWHKVRRQINRQRREKIARSTLEPYQLQNRRSI